MKTRKAKHIFHTDIWPDISCLSKVGRHNCNKCMNISSGCWIFDIPFMFFTFWCVHWENTRKTWICRLSCKEQPSLRDMMSWSYLIHPSSPILPVWICQHPHLWCYNSCITSISYMDVSEKIVGFPPKSSIFSWGFPLFSPSSLGVFPIFGNTHIYLANSRWPLWDCESSRDPNATDQWLER